MHVPGESGISGHQRAGGCTLEKAPDSFAPLGLIFRNRPVAEIDRKTENLVAETELSACLRKAVFVCMGRCGNANVEHALLPGDALSIWNTTKGAKLVRMCGLVGRQAHEAGCY